MSRANDHLSRLSPEERAGLNSLIHRFEDAWQAGQKPSIDDFLPAGARDPLVWLTELVHVDLEYRVKAGESVQVERDYLPRYPQLADDREILLALLAAEYELRRRREPGCGLEEFLRRFPQYTEELRTRLQDPAPNPADTVHTTRIESESAVGTHQAPGASPGVPMPPGYELMGELGRGGMGVVYQARQVALKRLVALKMMREGSAAGEDELSRFRSEAEAVARLQHPNIVQIYEVGAHNGLPFLSLEFCGGGSLADRLDGMPLEARGAAQLVETLARAIHYAHGHGVIHRDLKPANVLLQIGVVPGGGEDPKDNAAEREGKPPPAPAWLTLAPKIADFGLAKQLDDDSARTRSGIPMGTPSYMAPEQATGQVRAIGPATDVYALGALLYELLTGRPPFLGATVWDTLEQVCTQEPVPPSRLQPKVPRDLEMVCLKCLRKEPSRRYPSAEELACDLRRFLGGEPIRARPTPFWERALKWGRRRPAAAALVFTSFGAAAALAAVVLVYTSRLQAALDKARWEQGRAETSLGKANDAVDTYLSAVTEDPLLKEHDLRDLRRRLLESGMPFYQQLIAEQPDEPRPQSARARAHARLGSIAAETGQHAEARQHFEQAIAAFEGLAREHPEVADYRVGLAATHTSLGHLFTDTGHPDEARSAFETALALSEQLGHDDRDNLRYRLGQAKAHLNLGEFESGTAGRHKASEAAYRQALDVLGPLAEQHADVAEYRREHARALDSLGSLYFIRFGGRRMLDAEPYYRKARDIRAGLAREYPRAYEDQNDLAGSNMHMGLVCKMRRERVPAEEAFREAINIMEEQVRQHPAVGTLRNNLGATYTQLGLLYEGWNRPAEAETAYKKSLALFTDLTDRYSTIPKYVVSLGEVQSNLGDLAQQASNCPGALEWYDKAIGNLERAKRMDERNANVQAVLPYVLRGRAEAMTQVGRHADALNDWDRVVKLDNGIMRGWYRLQRAKARARTGDHARAIAEAAEIAEEGGHGAMYAYGAAVVHAASARTVYSDRQLSAAEHGRLAEQYAARAIVFLKAAQEAGPINDPDDVKELRQGEDFAALRARPDFQELLRQIGAPPAEKKKP